jgi:FixJ family two-component response regulator
MALMMVIDPEDEPLPVAGLLRRLYHLTEAEAEIALHLTHGADLTLIAEDLSISLTTVRPSFNTSSTRPAPTAKPSWSDFFWRYVPLTVEAERC